MDRSRLIAVVNGIILAIAVVVASIATYVVRGSQEVRISEFDVASLPGWDTNDPAPALAAFLRSCAVLDRRPDDGAIDSQIGKQILLSLYGRVHAWQAACGAAAQVTPNDTASARRFFESEFVAVRVQEGGQHNGLFTGYYEPEVRGSRQRSADFAVPLMRLPSDLVSVDLGDFRAEFKGEWIAGRVVEQRLKPYEDRRQIVSGALPEDALALAWLDDPVAAFFLQVQGSGRVKLTDGSVIRVGFAAFNGHPYTAIGRVLLDAGELNKDNVSLQSITAWLKSHPGEAAEVMNANASYVFFREIEVADPELGPPGAAGVQLSPGRSLAIDRRFVPLGAPVWLDSRKPGDDADQPWRQLMVAQDTGGAIRGAQRGDVFWGFGSAAADIAGVMAEPGRLYVLVPRAAVAERSVN